MKTIALCVNLPDLYRGGYRAPSVCKKYIGAGWLPHFVRLAEAQGYQVVSGYETWAGIRDVIVIQEELNQHGFQLIEKGAKPGLVFSMESPMYAWPFYDSLKVMRQLFPKQVLFSGGTHYMYFPCYEPEDIKPPVPWESRKPVCMISSNKQWWSFQHYWDSPSYCEAIRNELHTERLRAIEYFGSRGELDLYGPGWDNLTNIPPQWAHIKPIIQACWRGVVEDKLETLRQYKAAVALENVQMDGYKTEKPVHCALTETIPVAAGDLRILEYKKVRDRLIPQINARNKNNEFAQYLLDILHE